MGESDDTEAVILARIEVKLDNALTSVTDHETRIRVLESHKTGNHDERLGALERWRFSIPATMLVAICGLIGTVVVAVARFGVR